MQDEQRRSAGELVVDRQARDEQVDDGSAEIQAGNDDDGKFRCDEAAVQADAEQNAFGQLRVDERAADNGAEHDGGNGGAFHPAVGDDELFGRQQLGEDAVFGG